jgi:peptidoglycan/xylan/chitin deacetylase (PgdA/CDA1 family)
MLLRCFAIYCITGIFCCSVSPAESVETLIIEHGPRDSQKIALTFDACPTGRPDEYDDKVIDILLKENVPATLFMSGRWVEKNSEKAKFLANLQQFEIAAHSFYHPHMTQKNDERDIRELLATQAVISKVTGKTPRYFRPPYGEVDARVANLAARAGLITIQYDISSGDPDPNLSSRAIVRGVLKGAKGGSIIVFHMNKNGVRTAEVLPEIVDGLRKKGFTLVTVGNLLEEGQGTGRNLDLSPFKLKVSHSAPGEASPAQTAPF